MQKTVRSTNIFAISLSNAELLEYDAQDILHVPALAFAGDLGESVGGESQMLGCHHDINFRLNISIISIAGSLERLGLGSLVQEIVQVLHASL